MEIKFIGTGGAFDFNKGTAAAIVKVAGKKILIDCGYSTLPILANKDLAKDIDHILITHLHGDHIGSLSTLLPYLQIKLNNNASIITPTEEFQNELHQFFTVTYEAKRANYVPITDFPEIGFVDTSNQHVEGMASFAYYFSEDNQLIYYSGDIGNADTAKNFLDTRKESNITVFHETTPRTDMAVHASYREVQEKLKGYETYVYHIAKENMPEDCTLKYLEDYPEFLA